MSWTHPSYQPQPRPRPRPPTVPPPLATAINRTLNASTAIVTTAKRSLQLAMPATRHSRSARRRSREPAAVPTHMTPADFSYLTAFSSASISSAPISSEGRARIRASDVSGMLSVDWPRPVTGSLEGVA